jgi:hypothetical protein
LKILWAIREEAREEKEVLNQKKKKQRLERKKR